MVLPSAEPQDWERALAGLHFPLSIEELRKRLREVGGLDSEVHAMIGRLERDAYDSIDQLVNEIRSFYQADGVPADKLPL
ncbi:MAG TPA: hypothetical protein VGR43_07980 [Dehalococcoidia bacterium]|jgi:hypothetical protein|nr:hypothetical protein [Dehalococcoidia bacterium]